MASLANVYFLIDDYQNSGAGAGAGGSGQQLTPDFTATTLTDAQCVAAQFAQLFNRPVRLVQKGGSPPWTPLYSPTTCRVLPSAVPQTILY
jgi:hypothetical protein